MDEQERDTIEIEDETLRAGFTILPNTIWRWKGLSPGAKLTYVALLSYAWQEYSCFPGQQRLADDMGYSVKTVQKYLQELADQQVIRVRRRGLTKTNVYVLAKLSTIHKESTS